jgi:hypothetical protein
MNAIWIYRNADGIVMAASVAEYTEPATLKQWRDDGQQPELVIAESVTLYRPLPDGAKVFQLRDELAASPFRGMGQ